MKPLNIEYKGYTITTDKSLMQVEAIHKWLSEESYWVKDIPYHTVKTSFDNSYCIGILKDSKQVGFGRLVTDYATFAYLADVYVLEEHRGLGLANKMLRILLDQDWTKSIRKIMLGTLDAHDIYKPFGFKELTFPERYMEISRVIDYKELSKNHDSDTNS